MWLLADLFHDLPEVGDVDKPKLVFFFDEAHLLFNDASKSFLDQVAQTVRLIRSKGVGVFFVTQSPTDVPDEVLAQLGSRVQHQLRAATPNDAKALKQTVNTYPTSSYDDLGKVILSLGIGEAIVTVMNERGAPTPVAWTRLRAPESLMGPAQAAAMDAAVKASPRYAKYAQAVDRESAREKLAAKLEAGAAKQAEEVRSKEEPKPALVLEEGRREAGRWPRVRRGEVRSLQGLPAYGGPRDRPRNVQVWPPLTSGSGAPEHALDDQVGQGVYAAQVGAGLQQCSNTLGVPGFLPHAGGKNLLELAVEVVVHDVPPVCVRRTPTACLAEFKKRVHTGLRTHQRLTQRHHTVYRDGGSHAIWTVSAPRSRVRSCPRPGGAAVGRRLPISWPSSLLPDSSSPGMASSRSDWMTGS